MGGCFTSLGEQPRADIARLNADGTRDSGFNSGTDSQVYSLLVQVDGKTVHPCTRS